MVNPRYSPFQAIVQKQRTVEQHKENSARLAYAFGTKETTGWGEFTFEDVIDFQVAFIERPVHSYGCSVDPDSIDSIRSSRYPRTWGQVTHWDIDKNGLYRGAWVVVEVEDRSYFISATVPDPEPNYTLIHDFTFIGTAMKPMDTAFSKSDVRFV